MRQLAPNDRYISIRLSIYTDKMQMRSKKKFVQSFSFWMTSHLDQSTLIQDWQHNQGGGSLYL
ncbi:hypothetical protein BLOT_013425 [Blomia tropicalis]|nr:hypothetical protein BLOT_013425 [Blomia tropicalis]